MNEMTRRCLYLSRAERAKLARILTESLEEEDKVDEESRFATLYKAATDVCGIGILTEQRDFNLVMGRRMIAYQMRKEGYSLCTIGKKLIKHHSSVLHMIRMMDDVIKYNFKEVKYWKAFQDKLNGHETDKGTNQDS